ncbi:MAG: LamG domain-containing protein [Bacteroidetes bacterium]|nr:LamG domain-containing protein [Bacteroidota bacterium]
MVSCSRTYDGDSLRVFINGVQKGSTALPFGMIQGLAYPIRIGRLSDQTQSQTRYWSGQIDEVRIWDRALDSVEINAKRLNHVDAAQETGLVGYWRFNAGSGTTIADQTTNGNNGTIASTTWSTLVPFNQTTTAPVIFPNGNTMTSSITAASYQWNLNGSPILGATTQTWTALSNGTYTLTIIDSIGCMATSGPYIITGVGLNEISAENILVKNESTQLTISLRSGEEIRSIEVYNSAMQRISTKESQGKEMIWEKGHLAKGIYTVIIQTKSSRSGVYRFVQAD